MGYHDDMEDYRDELAAQEEAEKPYGPQTQDEARVEALIQATRRVAPVTSNPSSRKVRDDLADGK